MPARDRERCAVGCPAAGFGRAWAPTARLVPASLFRIRSFLGRRGGVKIRPWLGVEEALDEFSRALARHEQDDDFWSELEVLLGALTADLKQRLLSAGKAVDNELLDPEQHRALVAQIRRALGTQTDQPAKYRDLAGVLPATASALLAVIGTVAALGCDSGSTVSETNPPAIPVADAASEQSSAGPTDAGIDTRVVVTLVDAGPADAGLTLDAACDPDGSDLTAIVGSTLMLSCLGYEQQRVTDCLEALNDSWRTGLAALFACNGCEAIRRYPYDGIRTCSTFCEMATADAGTLDPTFDAQVFLDSVGCPIPVYVGVRID